MSSTQVIAASPQLRPSVRPARLEHGVA